MLVARKYLWLIVGLAMFLLGWYLGVKEKQKGFKPEPAAPAIHQKDGSVVLERKETNPETKSNVELPPGAKLQRKITLMVKPQEQQSENGVLTQSSNASGWVGPDGVNLSLEKLTQSNPLVIDLSLVKMPDGTTRVVGKTGEGYTLEGLDQPVEPLEAPVAYKNALHISARLAGGGYGVFYTRDFLKRFTAGASIQFIQDKSLSRGVSAEAWASLGYRW